MSLAGARWLGPAGWGLYWPAFGLAHWVSLLTDLGGHLTLARSVARAPRRAGALRSTALRLKLALAAVAACAVMAAAPWLPFPAPLLLSLAAALLALSFTEWLGYYLRGLGRIIGESGLLAADCLVACLFGIAVLAAGGGLTAFALSQLAAHAAVLAGAWRYVGRVAPAPRSPLPVGPFLRQALPTGVAILLSLGSWRLGLLALARWTPAEVGYYSAAHRLLEVARFLPALAAAALFPSFSRRAAAHSPWPAVLTMAPASIAICWMMSRPAVATWIMVRLFGGAYAPGGPLLMVIIWALPAMAVNAILTFWLIGRGRVMANAALAAVHLGAHAAGLLWGLPVLGAAGAARALVCAEGALTAGALACLLVPAARRTRD